MNLNCTLSFLHFKVVFIFVINIYVSELVSLGNLLVNAENYILNSYICIIIFLKLRPIMLDS